MKKAFFINGGAGRVLCAIPALEYYAKNIDPTVVIVAEGWTELYVASETLRNNVYPANHKGLIDILKDREIITPEPYRLNAYFNQKCNLVQAFDMLINYKNPPRKIPETKEFNFSIGKADKVFAEKLINQAKQGFQKDKIVVFQPLGSGSRLDGNIVVDESGRSIETKDIIKIAKELSKNYGVIMMTNVDIPVNEPMGVMVPENTNLLQWMSIIEKADYFIGCDSVGQHMANAVNKPATVVIGATFPENITYPNNKDFTVIDNGKAKRLYSPIRISQDMMVDRNNEGLMDMTDDTVKEVISSVVKKLGTNINYGAIPQMSQPNSCGGGCH